MTDVGLWGLIPPILAVYLAIKTKDVFFSLASGILSGIVIITVALKQNFLGTFTHIVDMLTYKISHGWNTYILILCILLGGIMGLLHRSGAIRAFSANATKKQRPRSFVLIASLFLSGLLFLDTYFSALTVGSIIRPLADKKRISRAKLAYFAHTSAPIVCVLVPFSSWAVTIMFQISHAQGFKSLGLTSIDFFMRTIPYNLYALTSFVLLIMVILCKRDVQPMFKSEESAILKNKMLSEELYGSCPENITQGNIQNRACWFDMFFPLGVLIFSCIFFLIFSSDSTWTQKNSFLALLRKSDISKALNYGAFATLVFTYVYFLGRRVLTVTAATNAFLEGIKSIMSAVVVLLLAWVMGYIISAVPNDGGMGLPFFIKHLLVRFSPPLWIAPLVLLFLSSFIALTTGSGLVTCNILIPLVIPSIITLATEIGLSPDALLKVVFSCVGAVISGAVFGDNASPISDNMVLSAMGAECPHLEHVATQIPYAIIGIIASGFGFLIDGLTSHMWLVFVITFGVACTIYYLLSRPLPKII